MPWQPFRRKGNKHRPLREDKDETSFAQEMTVPRSYSDGNLVRAPSERLLLGDWTSQRSYGTCSGGASNWTSFTEYMVEEGDTLAGIALRFNITIQDLKQANKLWTNEGLWPGKSLRIPHIEAKETSLDLSGSASETMSTDSQVSGDSSRHPAGSSSRDSSLAPSASGYNFNASPVSLPLQRSLHSSKPMHSKFNPLGNGEARTSVEDLSSFLTAMDSCIAINKKASISLIKSSKLKPDQREQLVSQTSLPVDFLSNNNTSNDRTRENGSRSGSRGRDTASDFDNIC